MRISRIYHPGIIHIAEEVILSKNASNHLLRVLRTKPNAAVCLFDGKGNEYAGALMPSRDALAVVKVEAKVENASESPLQLHLGQGISRGEKMDFVIQKAVELGVTKITPLFTHYCEVKLSEERSTKRLQHWQSVAIHACEQSGRNYLPSIEPPQTLLAWLQQRNESLRLAFHPQATVRLAELPGHVKDVAILIGPEGGLSAAEIQLATAHQFQILSLGPRILRTETAALAAIALLQCKWGDIG
jgi:16S rRNA (uracil1498-N3)-methyltransferase